MHQNENDDRNYRIRVCLRRAHRVKRTSQRAILEWTVENESKR